MRICCYEFNLSRRNIKPMNCVVPWRWEKARVDGCEVPAKQRIGCAGFKEQRTVWIEASGGRRDSVVTWHVRVARVNAHVSTIYHLLFARFLRKIGAGYKDSDHLVPSFSVWRTPAAVALLFICPENQFFDTWRDVACIFLAYTFPIIFFLIAAISTTVLCLRRMLYLPIEPVECFGRIFSQILSLLTSRAFTRGSVRGNRRRATNDDREIYGTGQADWATNCAYKKNVECNRNRSDELPDLNIPLSIKRIIAQVRLAGKLGWTMTITRWLEYKIENWPRRTTPQRGNREWRHTKRMHNIYVYSS